VPRIISESDELLVVDKPAGLIVHSDGRTEETSVADWILQDYPALKDVGEPWISPQGEKIVLPGIVHRLDRTTSGVMLIAKTNEMYRYLKREFKARRIEKTYLAWVYGHMQEREGIIIAEIIRTSGAPKQWTVKPTTGDNGRAPSEEVWSTTTGLSAAVRTYKRAAVTKWKVLKETKDEQSGEPISLLEIKPLTGRTHQIRVHLSSIGHPIIADHLYAPDRAPLLNFQRPALHAYTISFSLGGERKTFLAPPPADFYYSSVLQNTRIKYDEMIKNAQKYPVDKFKGKSAKYNQL